MKKAAPQGDPLFLIIMERGVSLLRAYSEATSLAL